MGALPGSTQFPAILVGSIMDSNTKPKPKQTKNTKKSKNNNEDVGGDMDHESLSVTASSRNNPRKRKEQAPDSESSTGSRTVKRKQLICCSLSSSSSSTSSSSEDEHQSSDEECSSEPHTKGISLYEDLERFCNLVNGNSAAKDIKKLKKKVLNLIQHCKALEEENVTLKQEVTQKQTVDTQIRELNSVINSVVDKITKIKADTSKTANKPSSSYAEKLKSKKQMVQEQLSKAPRHIVTVFPKEGSKIQDSDGTRQAICTKVAPVKEKLKIKALKRISNKGVLIETETKEDLESVLKDERLQSAGLMVTFPAKKRPRMMIYDIPSDLTEKEIHQAIQQQNFEGSDKIKIAQDFKLSFKTGKRDKPTVNWVAEVTPEIRETLKKRSKVYIGWSCCSVRDFISVSRCYKCQAFGHVAKHCKATTDTCGHCAKEGHTFNNCPAKSEKPQCANCKKARRQHDHSIRSLDCPAHRNALATHVSRTDYGQQT